MAVRSYGRSMVVAAWILFLLLVTWLFQGLLQNQHNPNSSPSVNHSETGQIEVRLKRNRSGHYVTNGTINGKNVVFLVDTGATDVALSDGLAQSLGLRPGASIILSTANGRVRGYKSRIAEISVGDIVQRDIAAVISPGIADNAVLLGMSFLKNLELVQKGRTLTLRTAEP
ncbi:MAG: aspartyl protease family protein [Parasphingorhabdus sp.]|jgi:aspartyl protease family protein